MSFLDWAAQVFTDADKRNTDENIAAINARSNTEQVQAYANAIANVKESNNRLYWAIGVTSIAAVLLVVVLKMRR